MLLQQKSMLREAFSMFRNMSVPANPRAAERVKVPLPYLRTLTIAAEGPLRAALEVVILPRLFTSGYNCSLTF